MTEMTSTNENVLTMAYAYQTKARNPRNTVAATNPVYCLGSWLLIDKHKSLLESQTLDLLLRFFGDY